MLASILIDYMHNLWQYPFYHVPIFVCTVCTITVLYNVIYNRYFHCLSRFPGPFWGSITDFHNTYLFSTRRVHLELLALHCRYGTSKYRSKQINTSDMLNTNLPGPNIRQAPNLLCFSDPTLLPDIYHRHAEKTPFYSTGMAGEVPPLLQTQNDMEHAAKLKTLSPTVLKSMLIAYVRADYLLVLNESYKTAREDRG